MPGYRPDGVAQPGQVRGQGAAADVIATFLPSRENMLPLTFRAIGSGNLSGVFFRAAGLNTIFIMAGTVSLKGPEMAYRYLMDLRSPKGEEQNESIHKLYYSLLLMNLLIAYKFRKNIAINTLKLSKFIAAKSLAFLYEDTLNNTLINEHAMRSEVRPPLSSESHIQLKELCDQKRLLSIDPRPAALKNLIRFKIFSSMEATGKDLLVLALLLFNQFFIGSRLLTVSGWLLRARILGKDLGISQLAALGISNQHLQNIQGHRNFRFLGEGIAYFGAYDVVQRIFNHYLELNNPLLNIAISSLVYKFGIVSNYMKVLTMREEDYKEEGMNFSSMYRPQFINPAIDRIALRIEGRIRRRDEERAETPAIEKIYKEVKATEKNEKNIVEAVQGQPSGEEQKKNAETEWWNRLFKRLLSPAERDILQIHAPNLIFLLSTIRYKRSISPEKLENFLGLIFPKRVLEILLSISNEMTDERIDNMIRFLLIHQKSEFEDWIFYHSQEQKPSLEALLEGVMTSELPYNKIDVKEIHRTTAKLMECWDKSIINIEKVDEQENPDEVLNALVSKQYETLEDEDEIRTVASPIQTTREMVLEYIRRPAIQFLYNLSTARSNGTNTLQFLAEGTAESVSSLKRNIEAHVPGGTTTLKVAALASPIVMGGPVGVGLGLSAAAVSTVAEHADEIGTGVRVGASVVTAVAQASMRTRSPSQAEQSQFLQSEAVQSEAMQSELEQAVQSAATVVKSKRGAEEKIIAEETVTQQQVDTHGKLQDVKSKQQDVKEEAVDSEGTLSSLYNRAQISAASWKDWWHTTEKNKKPHDKSKFA